MPQIGYCSHHETGVAYVSADQEERKDRKRRSSDSWYRLKRGKEIVFRNIDHPDESAGFILHREQKT